MDSLVRDVFGLKSVSGDVGVEIEVEGRNLPNQDQYLSGIKNTWRIELDGSLRGQSYEYVLMKPLPIKEVEGAIQTLTSVFEYHRSKVNKSVRAGVHIHINVQKLTLKQLATMITCYFALEELLITFCEPSRKGNHFCLRASDAEYLIFKINEFFNTKGAVLNNEIRYAAINLLALQKYGSLEFRTLETPVDFSKVSLWANILYTLKKNSSKFDSPIDVIESMSVDGHNTFVKKLLGKYSKQFSKEDIEHLVIRGVRNAQNIAYGVDWDGERKGDQKPNKRFSELHDMTRIRAGRFDPPPPPPPSPRREE